MSGDTQTAKPRMGHPAVTICLGHHTYVNIAPLGKISWICRVCGWTPTKQEEL